MQLEGKVALINGWWHWHRAAVAERFVAEGAKVCITGRRREKLEQVANSLPAGSITVFSGMFPKKRMPRRWSTRLLA